MFCGELGLPIKNIKKKLCQGSLICCLISFYKKNGSWSAESLFVSFNFSDNSSFTKFSLD